jgi:hypothetical protein
MKMRIQHDDSSEPEIEELVCLSREAGHLSIEQPGLSLDEAKDLLAKTQTTLITHQAKAYLEHIIAARSVGRPFRKTAPIR